MGRSRVSGRSKPGDSQFGWYFAGEPMDKRHSRSERIRLVRYGPEMEPCAHSRCPSPSPIPEKTPCACNNTCELHSHGTRSQSQSDSDSSGSDSGYSSSESATKRYGSRDSTRRERRSNDTRPTTPNSSDFSDYELPRRRRGHRVSTGEPEHHPQLEKFQREAHAPPPSTTATSGQRYHSPRASLATAPRPGPVVQRHCRKASYCERHPELCRALITVPSPVPRPTPTPTRSPRSIEKPRHKPRVKPEPKRTYTQPASPPKQMPPTKPVPAFKPMCPRHGAQHCGCVYMDGYHADDSSYYAPYDDDTVSETSIRAMPDHDRAVDETRCAFHHRCRPKFECGVGWVCGRK
ncbi:hypothetical protein N7530_004251 [Penicillium desertorum]|uniref:Uncharacterized protein n=1 Tax=Penicillium desertorum TaxID=1303715 RepID=A0A9W9WYC5_9EURO|nr:hypothetical protein N7530_004251 [Penicillium desertorum]